MPAQIGRHAAEPLAPPHATVVQTLATYKRLGGPQAVDAHTGSLKSWLYDQASKLQHSNGKPLLKINSPRCGFALHCCSCKVGRGGQAQQ